MTTGFAVISYLLECRLLTPHAAPTVRAEKPRKKSSPNLLGRRTLGLEFPPHQYVHVGLEEGEEVEMRSIKSSARALVARAGAVALAMPMLLGGAVPASAAIVSHAMTPAVGSSVRYEYAGSAEDFGQIHFGCQLRSRDPNFPRAFCYGPDQIRAAYDIQSVLDSGTNGAGQTIVIVDAFSSPTLTTDLAAWNAVWGICGMSVPATTACPAPPSLKIIAPDGLTPFVVGDPNQVGWSSEISLDVEWAHAI